MLVLSYTLGTVVGIDNNAIFRDNLNIRNVTPCTHFARVLCVVHAKLVATVFSIPSHAMQFLLIPTYTIPNVNNSVMTEKGRQQCLWSVQTALVACLHLAVHLTWRVGLWVADSLAGMCRKELLPHSCCRCTSRLNWRDCKTQKQWFAPSARVSISICIDFGLTFVCCLP